MSQELDALKSKMSEFALKLADISANSPPPGPNAANGYFREGVTKIPPLPAVGDPSLGAMNDETKSLYDVFQKFQVGVIQTFVASENYKADWLTDISLASEFKDIAGDVLKICGDIVEIIISDGSAAAAVIAQVKQHIQQLVDDVNKNKNLKDGTNANGHISEGINKVATETTALLQRQWSDDAKKLEAALEITCKGLTQLKTTGHDPWLRASWQVEFQGIMESLGRALA